MPEARKSAVVATQAQLREAAVNQLRIIGGELTKDDEVTFDGRKFVFPEQYRGDLGGLKDEVDRYVNGQEEKIRVQRTFNYRPHDGANAVFEMLTEHFGYARSKGRNTMFGIEPPNEITIPIGFVHGEMQHRTVPFDCEMLLPGLKGARMQVTSIRGDLGFLLHLNAVCRRADKSAVEGFYNVVQAYLESNSIYRGQAVNGAMEFFDVDLINPAMFVYSQDVWAQVETNILSPLKHAHVLRAEGLSPKRVVLLEGPFGTGKSGLGRTAAKIAVANGVTAIIARPGIDNPFDVMLTARLYQPAMVFIEDVDTFSSNQDPDYVTKLLDRFDGFDGKDISMTLVLTTNHVEKIHKGMLRPGRLDSVIHIGAMDREGVEKLTRLVVKKALADDIDFDRVYEATIGFMPAYVKGALEQAVRYTIARTGAVGPINTDDLVRACESLRPQFALQEAAADSHEKLPPLDMQLREMIRNEAAGGLTNNMVYDIVESVVETKLDNAVIYKPNGDTLGELRTAG